MLMETKHYTVTEIYVEDKSAKVIKDIIEEYAEKGFSASFPQAHFGKHGYESERMWWTKLYKKTEVENVSELTK